MIGRKRRMNLATCHPNRKHKAKGLCGSCYDKLLKEKNSGYKERQLSNTAKWCKANPKKYEFSPEKTTNE